MIHRRRTILIVSAIFAIGCGAPVKKNTTPPDNDVAVQVEPAAEKPTADNSLREDQTSNVPKGMHPSWDRNKDGINDCENDGSCDHTVDYTKARED